MGGRVTLVMSSAACSIPTSSAVSMEFEYLRVVCEECTVLVLVFDP